MIFFEARRTWKILADFQKLIGDVYMLSASRAMNALKKKKKE